jgi:hypothetical protein
MGTDYTRNHHRRQELILPNLTSPNRRTLYGVGDNLIIDSWEAIPEVQVDMNGVFSWPDQSLRAPSQKEAIPAPRDKTAAAPSRPFAAGRRDATDGIDK